MNETVNPNLHQKSMFEGLTTYHWIVFFIASSGWLFDCMVQRFFVLAREPAMMELLAEGQLVEIKKYTGYATTALILGWATGGIIFGMMSDKVGRVKTMVVTLLVYTGFTGLSGFSYGWIDFVIYRFLMGLGVGGMFGAATTLLAESVPPAIRALALGSLQALSAMGNILGSLIAYYIRPTADMMVMNTEVDGWRLLFFVGVIPAILIIPIITLLREPESWKQAKLNADSGDDQHKMGTIQDLFAQPRWRRNTIVGLCIGVSGMIGLWGIGFYSPELITTALQDTHTPDEIDGVRSIATAWQDVGAFFGMMAFTMVATFLSRRLAFLMAFVLCFFTTIYVFNSLNTEAEAYFLLPLMGFAQLSLFGGYSIYFPELFPTRLRGTGVGFCYNTVRYLAAPFPILLGYLTTTLTDMSFAEPFRVAAMIMACIYLLGMIALIWAPETKGKDLPEEA